VSLRLQNIDWNRPQPAPMALYQYMHANFPACRNMGIFNHRLVAGTNTLSHHAEGRALDIGLRAAVQNEKWLADKLFEIFVKGANSKDIDEIIWNRQIWSAKRPFVHPHRGSNPHADHIHVGFTREGSQKTAFAHLFILRIPTLRTGMEDLGERVGGTWNRA
jgi:hypothetical protein